MDGKHKKTEFNIFFLPNAGQKKGHLIIYVRKNWSFFNDHFQIYLANDPILYKIRINTDVLVI